MARIIYVEDDDVMGELVRDILTEAGHLVGVIGHGTLAFETIAFKKPELMILDRSLPGMSGLEIVQRVRRIPALYLTPVLMLTGKSAASDVDEGIGAGADDYLAKPFKPEELVARVQELLNRGSFQAQRRSRAEGK